MCFQNRLKSSRYENISTFRCIDSSRWPIPLREISWLRETGFQDAQHKLFRLRNRDDLLSQRHCRKFLLRYRVNAAVADADSLTDAVWRYSDTLGVRRAVSKPKCLLRWCLCLPSGLLRYILRRFRPEYRQEFCSVHDWLCSNDSVDWTYSLRHKKVVITVIKLLKSTSLCQD